MSVKRGSYQETHSYGIVMDMKKLGLRRCEPARRCKRCRGKSYWLAKDDAYCYVCICTGKVDIKREEVHFVDSETSHGLPEKPGSSQAAPRDLRKGTCQPTTPPETACQCTACRAERLAQVQDHPALARRVVKPKQSCALPSRCQTQEGAARGGVCGVRGTTKAEGIERHRADYVLSLVEPQERRGQLAGESQGCFRWAD